MRRYQQPLGLPRGHESLDSLIRRRLLRDRWLDGDGFQREFQMAGVDDSTLFCPDYETRGL